MLADLPGYGYARVAKERKAGWRPLIEGYLGRTPVLRGTVLLLDIRHDPTEEDLAMLNFLSEVAIPTLVIATKIDKLTHAAADGRVHALGSALGLDESQLIPFSAVTGQGRDELAAAVAALVAQPMPPIQPVRPTRPAVPRSLSVSCARKADVL